MRTKAWADEGLEDSDFMDEGYVNKGFYGPRTLMTEDSYVLQHHDFMSVDVSIS